jgi:hypothetical protein
VLSRLGRICFSSEDRCNKLIWRAGKQWKSPRLHHRLWTRLFIMHLLYAPALAPLGARAALRPCKPLASLSCGLRDQLSIHVHIRFCNG